MNVGGVRPVTFLFGLLTGLLAAGVVLLISGQPAGEPVTLQVPETPALHVHVTGAVARAGVYALPPGSLLQDALHVAGGAAADADLASLNLAQPLVHGMQVRVPVLPATATPSPTSDPSIRLTPTTPAVPSPTARPASTAGAPTGLININMASASQLDTLPGIGPSLAQRIIEYRETVGPFLRIEDIQNVSGIGPATFEKLKDRITVV